ncbi:NADPH-dependent aldehyde reductase Ahr [Legionella micdadei]|uniref:alcohol dehydrogenase (NADP(+)) n=1 Tax=Legionella micdadei TaxID=451 RepID=A0A098GJ31_LEGMI|nr:NAD(P)-dependent alcohol dehydrogenase [Legionella micdadei]ARG96647.1 alcohol dehydrogenase [Legionella micdadei]ARG99394.1 alcohol dehydrogenase [Legionella micdadei]KTD26310.1 putative alcohol dehydrogenase, Zn-dependent and NAD(P)-binding protein [Legionella micdadei]NSL19115.1 NAD(P)-dependent alcohol dehydrogenase [Legionella micdadei]CEG61980.1 putative alcohol dehydrogenase, Zn-dependent and NAD(P)-binding [Legionella micdadei]
MTKVHAYATHEKSGRLTPFEFTLGEIGPGQVDIQVESCGVCHSDLSMIDDEWGFSNYPIVPGHEVVGTVIAMGEHVNNLKVGQRVGLGWFSGSCMYCHSCLSGDHNLCAKAEQTIVGRHGGFANVVRCNSIWAIALPDELKAYDAGPLLCGGITVFNPIVQFDIRPTFRVGVIGIGGLGHLALQFLHKWGCEVTAFSSTEGKEAEAKRMGAHYVVNTNDNKALQKLAGVFDFLLNTTNANLNWAAYLELLAPHGRLHTVGAVPNPIPAPAFSLIFKQRSLSGSPLGSPATIQDMLEFCVRHNILPLTEHFAMKDVNRAIEHLRAGKARYRIVLDN